MGVINQENWSSERLSALGFKQYQRKKQLVMARKLPEAEAPMTIKMALEVMSIDSGYMICYDPGHGLRPTLKDYDHWPVEGDIFTRTYRSWDEAEWTPTPAESHLMCYGCLPYFKIGMVWGRRLTASIYVQSIESDEPVLVPPGFWLLIGALGEPWYIDEQTFRFRYSESSP